MKKTNHASVLFPFPTRTRITARMHRSKTETQCFMLYYGIRSCLVCADDFPTNVTRGQP